MIAIAGGGGGDLGGIGAGLFLGDRVANVALAAHHRQGVAVDLAGVEGFEHPGLRFREAPGEGVGHPSEHLGDGDLGEHGKGEAAEPARHVDAGETELQGKALMVLRDAVRQPALVQLGMLLIGHKLLLDKGADTPRPVHGGGGQGVGRAAIAGGVVAHARNFRAFRREMLREEGGEACKHRLHTFLAGDRRLHGHHVEPDALHHRFEAASDAGSIIGILALGDDLADDAGDGLLILLVIGAAMLEIGGTALGLGPEGAPGGKLARGADHVVEVGRQDRLEPLGRAVAGHGEGAAPVGAVFRGERPQGLDQQLLLAFEVEIDNPAGEPGGLGDVRQGGCGIAAAGQDIDRRLDQLLTANLLRGLAGSGGEGNEVVGHGRPFTINLLILIDHSIKIDL